MRLRCRFGIHEWEPWALVTQSAEYYTQLTRCQCCGMYKVIRRNNYSGR